MAWGLRYLPRDTGSRLGKKDVANSGHLVLEAISYTQSLPLCHDVPSAQLAIPARQEEAVTEMRAGMRKARGSDVWWHLDREAHVP